MWVLKLVSGWFHIDHINESYESTACSVRVGLCWPCLPEDQEHFGCHSTLFHFYWIFGISSLRSYWPLLQILRVWPIRYGGSMDCPQGAWRFNTLKCLIYSHCQECPEKGAQGKLPSPAELSLQQWKPLFNGMRDYFYCFSIFFFNLPHTCGWGSVFCTLQASTFSVGKKTPRCHMKPYSGLQSLGLAQESPLYI